MLTIQRKTSFNGITFSFMRKGKLIAAHVSGLLLSQAIAKMYGNAMTVCIQYKDGREVEDQVIMRRVVQADPMQDSETFIDMCLCLDLGTAFAEVPLIAMRSKTKPEEKAVKRVVVRDADRMEKFLIEQRDAIEAQSLYEFLVDSELRNVRHVVRFLGLTVEGGTEVEDHADEIVEVPRAVWHEQFLANEMKLDEDAPLVTLAQEAIFFMENKHRVDASLSFDDDEDFDFEDETEIFSEEFDGDNIEETILSDDSSLEEDA